jgi:hypothetical protein
MGFCMRVHCLLMFVFLGSLAAAAQDLFDTEGHAHRAYDAKDGMLVLVRPDGYIGLIANGLSSVHTYLEYLIAR